MLEVVDTLDLATSEVAVGRRRYSRRPRSLCIRGGAEYSRRRTHGVWASGAFCDQRCGRQEGLTFTLELKQKRLGLLSIGFTCVELC